MEKPIRLQRALERLEARRVELERQIVEELERKFFDESELTTVDLTDSADRSGITQDEEQAFQDIVARYFD